MTVLLAFCALLVELLAGYPDRLYRAAGHPVTWIGAAIKWLDERLNRQGFPPARRRFAGVLALVVLLALAIGSGLAITWLMSGTALGFAALAVIAISLLAQRSLASHVGAVADGLDHGGIVDGRKAVSMVVGRDTESLDEAGVCRAAIESMAENFSDGVVAPAFWLGVGGLAGAVAYKAVNTADSMIGHRTERHRDFGWASARFDDLVNLPASRLSALLIVLAAFVVPGASPARAWSAVWRDARNHKSPNAGWPEAAMAGALGLALAGPRVYAGVVVDDVFMGDGRREATAGDIRRALKLFWIADMLMVGLFGALAGLVWLA